MRKIIPSLIWMVVIATAMPALKAQQPSPSQTATQQTAKPKATRTSPFPQPTFHPTPATTANNNPRRNKRIDENPRREKTTNDNHDNYADDMRRYRHERHDHDWWRKHYVVIVLVGRGYYYWDSGYWCPAWGYDPNYERYDYDGPIYTYGNLLPDQVIVNVQHALKELGYYDGDVTGSLGVTTQRALVAYQEDAGLDATGAVDEATVRALGLI